MHKAMYNPYQVLFNPFAPMSDCRRISPYNINTISSRQVVRMKKISIREL